MSLVISLGLALQRPVGAPATIPPPPVNTVPPAITGTAQVGQTLAASTGAWSNSPTGFTYAWRRGSTTVGTAATYVPAAGDVGATLTVRVTASNAGGASSPATSAATAAVTAAAVPAPVNSAVPSITGTAQEGQTLTASTGTWTNSPTGFAYAWRRGSTTVGTAATYAPAAGDVGATLTVQVTASNAGGASSPATSAPTAAVTAAVVAPTLFPFVLENELGATAFTSVPNLRVSLDGGATWHALGTGPAAALTISVDPAGDALLVDGFTNAATQAPRFHFEQRDAFEVNNGAEQLFALYAVAVGQAPPVNTTMPGGLQIAATHLNAAIGVV